MIIKNILLHPSNIGSQIRWWRIRGSLDRCGDNVKMGNGFVIKGPENISIGSNTVFYNNCELCTYETYYGRSTGYYPKLKIGSNVTFTANCAISCLNLVSIGDGCLFGVNTFISDNSHGKNTKNEILIPPNARDLFSKGPVNIGQNVWCGRNVCILAGVTIGDNSIIGANAVVTHDVPENCVAAGIPAKVIKIID